MNTDQAIALSGQFPIDSPSRAFEMGLSLLREDFAEIVLPLAEAAAGKHPQDYRMHQLLGLAARSAGDSGRSYAAFAKAAQLAPHDPLIAHSLARSALDAGKPSVSLFDHAISLAPADGSAIQGRAAALFSEGQADAAQQYLADILEKNPLWAEGHRALAHIRGQSGLDPLASIDQAIRQVPAHEALHQLRVRTLLEARDLGGADAAIKLACDDIGQKTWLLNIAAHVASESGDLARADALFAALPAATTVADASLAARHMIRAGKAEEASKFLDPWIQRDTGNLLWPYLSLVWRLTDDPRYEWLEGSPTLIGIYDLSDHISAWNELAEQLRALHIASAAPLDQSVRGGTQTDGNLLLRQDGLIPLLREKIVDIVSLHVAQLPPPQAGHPTLLARRTPQRIAGSWSVRLSQSGFHSDHVHTAGWISSALYISLPEDVENPVRPDDRDGWLSLGQCRDLVPALEPVKLIQPAAGKLVLFPSTMWHGTRPFSSGERLTVAFDIAPPKQS